MRPGEFLKSYRTLYPSSVRLSAIYPLAYLTGYNRTQPSQDIANPHQGNPLYIHRKRSAFPENFKTFNFSAMGFFKHFRLVILVASCWTSRSRSWDQLQMGSFTLLRQAVNTLTRLLITLMQKIDISCSFNSRHIFILPLQLSSTLCLLVHSMSAFALETEC